MQFGVCAEALADRWVEKLLRLTGCLPASVGLLTHARRRFSAARKAVSAFHVRGAPVPDSPSRSWCRRRPIVCQVPNGLRVLLQPEYHRLPQSGRTLLSLTHWQ